MSDFTLQDATRVDTLVKMSIAGPAGVGKTYTSLKLAKELAEGGLIVVIDSQHQQARKQAGKPGIPPFKFIDLDNYSPRAYLDALAAAYKAQAKVIIIDSLSHAWEGVGGVLEIAGASRNKFQDGWREATPLHNKLVEKILAVPAHTICTLRSHTGYEVTTTASGKTEITKLGMQPIQRKGIEYEFDFAGTMNQRHTLHIEKSVIDELDVAGDIPTPGADLGQMLLAWSKGQDLAALTA